MKCNVCFLETNITETMREFKKYMRVPLAMNDFFYQQPTQKTKKKKEKKELNLTNKGT